MSDVEAPTHKRCPSCAGWLPVSEFGLLPRRSSRPYRRDAKSQSSLQWKLSSWCRACKREATGRWRESNRSRIAESRRTPPTRLTCVECAGTFEGRRDRLVCSRGCKDRRYARLHPVEYRAKLARRLERLRG